MTLTSSGFKAGGMIPDSYSRDGRNLSPPLAWDGAPRQTKTFALVVHDPDAPSGDFVHWLLYDIPAETTALKEGVPKSQRLKDGALQGRNDFGNVGYDGPQPPSGTHRYLFHLYALDSQIPLHGAASRKELDQALRGHVLAECELSGKYQHH